MVCLCYFYIMEFTLSALFDTTPETLYNTWLSSEGHAEMTGGEAHITDQVGDEFNAWDEYITGKNIALEPGKRIVQQWRTDEFSEDEPDSLLEIQLEAVDDKTKLTLHHSNLPEHGEQYKQGWEDHYFTPMREYFTLHP